MFNRMVGESCRIDDGLRTTGGLLGGEVNHTGGSQPKNRQEILHRLLRDKLNEGR